MSNKRKRYHGLQDSPFFNLKSRGKLASLLFVSQNKLRELSRDKNLYHTFPKLKSSGGVREIAAPRQDLKKIQARISNLLQRISPPDYLFAPVSGRSYVDNAAVHLGANAVRLLDIEDFFPSCTGNKVIWFFRSVMKCSPDVAATIKMIVTRNESLPQGSPCSPILAYLCYIDMWEEISTITRAHSCHLSVYADDLTISGEIVPEKAIWRVKQILRRHGHRYQMNKERSKYLKPAEITGVVLYRDRLFAPNRFHKRLWDVRHELTRTKSDDKKITLQRQLGGRRAKMEQIISGNRTRLISPPIETTKNISGDL